MRRLAELPRAYLLSAGFLTLLLSLYLLSVTRREQSSWHNILETASRSTDLPTVAPEEEQQLPNPNSLDSVFNETLGFQKILVINMKSRTDHRDQASLAASLTGLKVEYVDGVTEFDKDHSLPVRPEDLAYQGKEGGGFGPKVYLSWRAHVNAIRMIVEQNLTSALIMEDDADYDVRIKQQAYEFARASRLLLQPIEGTKHSYLDPTFPRQSRDDKPFEIDIDEPAHPVTEPKTSPYADVDRWDVFWMGHCGSHPAGSPALQHPLGRVVKRDDETAIEVQHYDPGYGDRVVWPSYPNKTRLYFHAKGPVCNLAYAISLPGAKRLLYQIGIKNMTGTTDNILNAVCDGGGGEGWRYKKRTCLSVLPTLFQHHRPKAYPHAYTEQIHYGTRANFDKLIDGDTDYYDAFPDGDPMALYFHHDNALKRYQNFLNDPDPIRQKEEKIRGVVETQAKLRKEKQQQREKALLEKTAKRAEESTKFHEPVS